MVMTLLPDDRLTPLTFSKAPGNSSFLWEPMSRKQVSSHLPWHGDMPQVGVGELVQIGPSVDTTFPLGFGEGFPLLESFLCDLRWTSNPGRNSSDCAASGLSSSSVSKGRQ